MKKVALIIKVLLLVILAYVLYETIRTRIVFNSTKMVPIDIKKNYYTTDLEEMLDDSAIILSSYCIEEKDTLITFNSGERNGALWIVSNDSFTNTQKLRFEPNANISEFEDGTYKNYNISDPLLRISYKKKKEVHLQKNFSITSDYKENTRIKQQILGVSDVWKLVTFNSIEMRNTDNQLVYRVDLGKKTEAYFYMKHNALRVVLVQ